MFEDLAKSNADFYDNHPVAHAAVITAVAIGTGIAINVVIRKIVGNRTR